MPRIGKDISAGGVTMAAVARSYGGKAIAQSRFALVGTPDKRFDRQDGVAAGERVANCEQTQGKLIKPVYLWSAESRN